MQYLITGATGNVGGRVTERLIARGERPRVLVRDAERARARFGERVEVVIGDLADDRTFEAALLGIDALLLVSSGPTLAAQDASMAQAAKLAKLKRIVKLSAMGARASGFTTAVAEWHAQGEAAIRARDLPYTFIRPVGFMSNALAWARSIQADGVVRASTGAGRIAMIHPDDIANVAIEALTTQAYEGQALAITGPEALTYTEMTAKIGAAIGRTLRFEAISDAQARANLLGVGMAPALVEALVLLWSEVREGLVSIVTGEVERVTRRPPITFDQWAADHAAAFV